MLILMSSRWLLHFLLIIPFILIISEGKRVGGRRGDSFGIPLIVDYYPHQKEESNTRPPQVQGNITPPQQEQRAITHPQTHQEERAITHPQPHQEAEAITIKVETEVAEQRRGPHKVRQLYPGETSPPYSEGRISAANYPRKPRRHYGEYVRIGGVTYLRSPGYFCLIPVENLPPIYPERKYYRKNTLERKLIQPLSGTRKPDNMNHGELSTETNMYTKPEKKKRIRNAKKNRKNKPKFYRKNRPKKDRTNPDGMESVTNVTYVSIHSSETTTQETVTTTSEPTKRQPKEIRI